MDRRTFLGTSTSIFVAPALLLADVHETTRAIKEDFGEITLLPEKIAIELPNFSDTGKSIPLSVTVPRNLINKDYVETIAIYPTLNPNPRIAHINFGIHSFAPTFSTRIRLDISQEIWFVIKFKSGKFIFDKRHIDLNYGACDEQIANLLFTEGWTPQIKIALPKHAKINSAVEVRTIIKHPMQNGNQYNVEYGGYPPTRIIEKFNCWVQDEIAFSVNLDTAIAPNPYFSFFLKFSKTSEVIFEWLDTNGQSYIRNELIMVD